MIKAVIFDIDGVLLDSFEANYKYLQDLGALTKLKIPSIPAYRKMFAKPLREIMRAVNNVGNLYEIETVLEPAFKKVNYPLHLAKFYERCNETIKELHKEYKLGIVTSRRNPALKKYLEFSKNKKYFRVTVGLDDVKNHKPHPEPLLFACKRLKVKPREAIYVGDALSDIQAAHAAGMKAVAYNKKPIKSADANISHFKNLAGTIKKLGYV